MQVRIALFALATLVVGCDAIKDRAVKKEFDKANDDATSALEAMKKADAKVLVARVALKKTSSSDIDAFVKVAHDYAEALRATVKPAAKFSDSLFIAFGETDTTKALRSRVISASSTLREKCDKNLKFDEIDPCGGAWGEMIDAANAVAERSTRYGQSWPKVRTEETIAAAKSGKGADDGDDDKPKKKASDDDDEKPSKKKKKSDDD